MLGNIFVMGYFYVTLSILFSLCFVTDYQRGSLLGSKTLGLNELELQFVMLANHDQNILVFVLDLLKVYLYVKLESSVQQDLLCKFAWLDQLKIRLNRLKLVQIVFLQNFPTQSKPV